jgi:hypothetical protein
MMKKRDRATTISYQKNVLMHECLAEKAAHTEEPGDNALSTCFKQC